MGSIGESVDVHFGKDRWLKLVSGNCDMVGGAWNRGAIHWCSHIMKLSAFHRLSQSIYDSPTEGRCADMRGACQGWGCPRLCLCTEH